MYKAGGVLLRSGQDDPSDLPISAAIEPTHTYLSTLPVLLGSAKILDIYNERQITKLTA